MTRAKRRPAPKPKAIAAWAREASRATPDELRALLLRQRLSVEEIASKLSMTRAAARELCKALRKSGANVQDLGGRLTISREPVQVAQNDALHRIDSDAHGRYRIGVISDTHLGSKYARVDVCDALYDWFASEGITTVLHGGNWIDGTARFNAYDLLPEAHGMQAQLDYFVRHYPQRKGIRTLYVAGDDHEGWFAQREGVQIGEMLEDTARRAGRDDLAYVGYIEAFFTLRHAKTRATSKLMLQHPGGGSAYALSYAPQKAIEALQPGEKPGVAIFGHWHKMEFANIRGVWSLQAGCTKDLDPFGRKKRLTYHVGGSILELEQGERGEIFGATPRMRYFWDREYTNGSFDLARPLNKRRAPHGSEA